MGIDKLIDDCATLENTVSILIKANGEKLQELNRLHSLILETAQKDLDALIETERSLLQELENLRAKRDHYELEIKQFTNTNSRLADLVALARRTENEQDEDVLARFAETYVGVAECINEFEQITYDVSKYNERIGELNNDIVGDTNEVKKLVEESQMLNVNLHKNDNTLRVLDRQNKYSEQQFDLILHQIPWEPLTDTYIESLRQSNNKSIRDLAEVLHIQANEIVYLNDTLIARKSVKLKTLEEFAKKLEEFAKRREEASLVEGHFNFLAPERYSTSTGMTDS